MDIKEDNFVKSRQNRQNDPLTPFKLIDFGSSVITNDKNFSLKSCKNVGSEFYLAPEIETCINENTGATV